MVVFTMVWDATWCYNWHGHFPCSPIIPHNYNAALLPGSSLAFDKHGYAMDRQWTPIEVNGRKNDR